MVEDSNQNGGSDPKADPPLDPEDDIDDTPTSPSKARRAFTTQTSPSASELRVISQPTDIPDLPRLPNFVFPEEAGTGVVIYHVEFGINIDNDVSASILLY